MPQKLLIVDGCPAPRDVAPYIALVLRDARQSASSIYRGDDARELLHRHGKRTQREVHADPKLAAISNPAGRSQHECRSDGFANPGPVGRKLEPWEVGVDSGTDSEHDKEAVERAAKKHGWRVRHPYGRGVEKHHWCFAEKPRARGVKQRLLIVRTRARLPRR